MRIIRKEKGIINGKIDYSCFSEIFLNILDDFQIWSLQEIYKFVFIIFLNGTGVFVGMNDQYFPDASVIQFHVGSDLGICNTFHDRHQ